MILKNQLGYMLAFGSCFRFGAFLLITSASLNNNSDQCLSLSIILVFDNKKLM